MRMDSKNKALKKQKEVSEKTIWKRIKNIIKEFDSLLLIVVFLIFVGIIIYLLCSCGNEGIANILDFIIATMSIIILLTSIVSVLLNDKWKYIILSSIYFVLMIIGLCITIGVGSRLNNPSIAGRYISSICLFVTLAIELGKVIIHNHKMNVNKGTISKKEN